MGEPVDRRSVLRWAIRGLSGIFAVLLGVPAVAYLIDPRNRPSPARGFRTVARLDDLEIGKPKLIVVTDRRWDAWTLYPNDVVGRVWLIRRDNNQVEAYNTTCPHLGCSINWTGSDFLCPCHGGRFDMRGQRREEPGLTNPAPRGMDTLAVNQDALRQGVVQVQYQEFVQGTEQKIARS